MTVIYDLYNSQFYKCENYGRQILWQVQLWFLHLFHYIYNGGEFLQFVNQIACIFRELPLLCFHFFLCLLYPLHCLYPFQEKGVMDYNTNDCRNDGELVNLLEFLQGIVHRIYDVYDMFYDRFVSYRILEKTTPPSTPSILTHCRKFVIALYRPCSKIVQCLFVVVRAFLSPKKSPASSWVSMTRQASFTRYYLALTSRIYKMDYITRGALCL